MDNILKNYQEHDVIYLLPHYYGVNDSLVDSETDYEPLDYKTLQDIDEQHAEVVHNDELERQYQEWIASTMKFKRNIMPDTERRRNIYEYRDSALFQHNTWNKFKVIELNNADQVVPGAVRGI